MKVDTSIKQADRIDDIFSSVTLETHRQDRLNEVICDIVTKAIDESKNKDPEPVDLYKVRDRAVALLGKVERNHNISLPELLATIHKVVWKVVDGVLTTEEGINYLNDIMNSLNTFVQEVAKDEPKRN